MPHSTAGSALLKATVTLYGALAPSPTLLTLQQCSFSQFPPFLGVSWDFLDYPVVGKLPYILPWLLLKFHDCAHIQAFGAGGVVRVPAAPAKDPYSVLSTHMPAHNYL